MELLKSYLAGENRIINRRKQTNRNRRNWNIWQNTRPTIFIRITFVFSYLCSKNKQTHCTCDLYSMCGGIKSLAQREDHVATRLPWL